VSEQEQQEQQRATVVLAADIIDCRTSRRHQSPIVFYDFGLRAVFLLWGRPPYSFQCIHHLFSDESLSLDLSTEMGQSHSAQRPEEVPIEELSHRLALRFATKCYSHLEIAHFKDNFKSLADHVDNVEFWKEDTLCRFFSVPEPLRAGPVLFQICSYLGAFPFPRLAPCIMTREATLKVVTIMTGRYQKVLKRGNRDKVKLLFRSMAVFDRRASFLSPSEKPSMKDIINEQKPDDMLQDEAALKEGRSHVSGFAIDEPANDDEDEDDDDLALAALDSLDAIEVFKQDQKVDRKINHALIPVENLKRLFMLLLLFGGVEPQSTLSAFGDDLTESKLKLLDQAASNMVAAFDPDPEHQGIRYYNFVNCLSTTMPDIFEPLNNLFEHFMFSKNIDMSKHKGDTVASTPFRAQAPSPIHRSTDDNVPTIFTPILLAQMAVSLHLGQVGSTPTNIYTSGVQFNQLYSTATHGTSLSSFGRQVFSWQSSTVLLISGMSSSEPSIRVLLMAYLPSRWKDSSNSHSHSSSSTSSDPSAPQPCIIQLSPRHAVFPVNPYSQSPSTPASYFSSKTGIGLGCVIPSQSRTGPAIPPIPAGPVSLLIDEDISTATFVHDPNAAAGAFNLDPHLASAQCHGVKSTSAIDHPRLPQPHTIEFDIDVLEVWGISYPNPGEGDDELTKQKKRLAWEEAEAARRRGVNFGGDKDGARALLEMAGLVGDKAGQGRSGGSV
jgi:TLD